MWPTGIRRNWVMWCDLGTSESISVSRSSNSCNMAPTKDFALMEKGVILDDGKNLAHQGEESSKELISTSEKLEVGQFCASEEKVPLELCRNGTLMISPSVAAQLYRMGECEPGEKVRGELDWEKIAGMKACSRARMNKTGWRKYGGIIFGLSASFFFSLSLVTVKILSDYSPLSVAVWRYCGLAIPAVPIIVYLKIKKGKKAKIFDSIIPFRDKEKLLNLLGLMLRGLLGCTSVLFRLYSLNYLSLADSTVISYCGPVFVVILGHFCLREKCGIVSFLLALFTSCGVFIIVRPPMLTGEKSFNYDMLIGSFLALSSMVCNSSVVILMRKIRQVHFALMLLTFGLWGVGESLVVAGSFGVLQLPQGMRDTILTFLVLPALVFCGQLSIIMALKYEKAGPVSLIRSCDVIFAFIWQGAFLNVVPDFYSIAGSVVVLVGVAMISYQKFLSTLPHEDSLRRRWRFFLA